MNKIINDLIYLSIDLKCEKSKYSDKLDDIIVAMKNEMDNLGIPLKLEKCRYDSPIYYCPHIPKCLTDKET